MFVSEKCSVVFVLVFEVVVLVTLVFVRAKRVCCVLMPCANRQSPKQLQQRGQQLLARVRVCLSVIFVACPCVCLHLYCSLPFWLAVVVFVVF